MPRDYPVMHKTPRPLIVRLRNWVGDVTLGLPTLQRLADAGYDLQLVGKPWARELLAGHGWPVHTLPKTLRERVALLRRLRQQAMAQDAGFNARINAVAFPFSFSSALEMRLAGLRAIGHAHEGRSLLLAQSVARPQGRHELEVYWHLGSALLGLDAAVPARIALQTTAAQQAHAQALIERHGLGRGFIVICPFAGGTFAGKDKTWPDFAAFAANELASLGHKVVVCPGPGEEAQAARDFAGAISLAQLDLGSYAALLARAAVTVSNDTGPGHMAAAVGTPLVSVLGPSEPAQWRAWGPGVHIVQRVAGWPTRGEVMAKVQTLLH
jgi:heptosyltransferase II